MQLSKNDAFGPGRVFYTLPIPPAKSVSFTIYELRAQPDNQGAGKFVIRKSEIVILKVVGVNGLEPLTPRLSSACSNQLSYTPRNKSEIRRPNSEFKLVELRRLELPTYSLQSYRSTN